MGGGWSEQNVSLADIFEFTKQILSKLRTNSDGTATNTADPMFWNAISKYLSSFKPWGDKKSAPRVRGVLVKSNCPTFKNEIKSIWDQNLEAVPA